MNAMVDHCVIAEKTSRAKDIRDAVGSRYATILRAERHLFDLLEPGTAAAGQALRHPAGQRRQQGVQAEGDPRLAAYGQTGLAGHRLRPRGLADRIGDPRALSLPQRGAPGEVYRPEFPHHTRRLCPCPLERPTCGTSTRLPSPAWQADQIYNLSLISIATVIFAHSAPATKAWRAPATTW